MYARIKELGLKPTVKSDSPYIKALTIEHALVDELCPYCGVSCQHIREHIEACVERRKNIEIDKNMPAERWGTHPVLGKVMFIRRQDGLCLVESDAGRYVVPISSLQVGHLSVALQALDDINLAPEEITQLINALRLKAKCLDKLPRYPELWPGCAAEVQMGSTVRQVTVQYKQGPYYYAIVDGTDTGVNITTKQVLRLV